MRKWTRAASDCMCGRCGKQLLPNDPIQEVQPIKHLVHPLIRCADCADSEVPPDLPRFERAPIQPRTKKMKPMTAAQMMDAIDRYRSPHSND